jgi:molybdopterin-guanine dinucleotide biosynthesis protein A
MVHNVSGVILAGGASNRFNGIINAMFLFHRLITISNHFMEYIKKLFSEFSKITFLRELTIILSESFSKRQMCDT